MNASTKFLGLLGAASIAALACSSSGGGGGGTGGGSGGTGGATTGGPSAPPTETGIPLVDRLGAAAAKCGKLSMFTVPGGWQNVAVGDKGCAVWVPPAWIVQGYGTPTVSSFADSSGTEGFVGIAGATQSLSACTPSVARASILDGFAQNGYSSPQILWHWEGTESFGGTDWATGHAVFSMSRTATPMVGYLWVLALPTVVACDVVGLGFWEPEARIESDTCTTLQVLSSVKCPSGGGCDPVECNQSCKDQGSNGGTCNSGCECY